MCGQPIEAKRSAFDDRPLDAREQRDRYITDVIAKIAADSPASRWDELTAVELAVAEQCTACGSRLSLPSGHAYITSVKAPPSERALLLRSSPSHGFFGAARLGRVSTLRWFRRKSSQLPNHRAIVATGFKILGLATALPSSLMAITMGIAACTATPFAAQQRPDYLSVTHYGLVGLLANAATGANEILSLLNGLAAVILGLLAVLALISALSGVLLYVVGRGMRRSAQWARSMAAAITVVMLLIGLAALWVLQDAARLAAAVSLILSIYVLWVLTARYAE